MSLINETKKKMEAALDHFREELKKIRTGQANPAMVENLAVEVYGTQMRLREVASISVPEPRQILVTPFDANNTAVIGKGIEKANIGFVPVVEGNCVRINIPSMDESMRKEMVKLCHKRREEGKISIRNVRKESNDAVKKQKGDGEITEDLVKKLEKEIQELTDKYCKEADTLSAEKEKDISTI